MKNHIGVILLIVKNDKVLLELANGSFWKLPGGHIELDENPIDTATREAKEELGIDIAFMNDEKLFDDKPWSKCLPTPFASFAHTVDRDGKLNEKHNNIVFAYLVHALNEPVAKEGQSIKWYSRDDIFSEEINDQVRAIVLKGFSLLHS